MVMPIEGQIGETGPQGKDQAQTFHRRPLHVNRPVTKDLIEDVEKLLIFLLEPRWNDVGKASCRLRHRNLKVICNGEWPHARNTFTYCNKFPRKLSATAPNRGPSHGRGRMPKRA